MKNNDVLSYIPSSPEICNDNIDNDNDKRTDCDDSDCFNEPVCQPIPVQAVEKLGILSLENLINGISLKQDYNSFTWPSELNTPISVEIAFESILDSLESITWDIRFDTNHYWFNPNGPYADYNNNENYKSLLFSDLLGGRIYYLKLSKDDILIYNPLICSDSDNGLTYNTK